MAQAETRDALSVLVLAGAPTASRRLLEMAFDGRSRLCDWALNGEPEAFCKRLSSVRRMGSLT
jgi:hypothetical protein